ncbi:hypothetical protein Syun_029021 [Stephania yunnanensis]|uniref:S-protein homolog n=1 Tax=Stephania yunnanensis TaxID=152371 RepID=A0AAP0E964_9MAGN
MARLHTTLAILLMIVALLFESSVVYSVIIIPGEQTVHLSNNISSSTILNVHCKSADNDLGPQTVHFHQDYNFSFHANIPLTTLFWCNVDWNSAAGDVRNSKAFDIYSTKICWIKYRDCRWYALTDGLYFFDNEKNALLLKFGWDH